MANGINVPIEHIRALFSNIVSDTTPTNTSSVDIMRAFIWALWNELITRDGQLTDAGRCYCAIINVSPTQRSTDNK